MTQQAAQIAQATDVHCRRHCPADTIMISVDRLLRLAFAAIAAVSAVVMVSSRTSGPVAILATVTMCHLELAIAVSEARRHGMI